MRLTIVKRVPVAAGLGGGSGDAAAALRLASLASGIEDPALLHELAGELGADVPAQVGPGRWLARGAGESLTELPLAREPFGVLVLPVAAALRTADVYAEADRLGLTREASELESGASALSDALSHGEQLPPYELLANDLQPAAVSLCPQVEGVLAQARAGGADVALVSGSGPTVLGLFAGRDGLARARRAANELAGRAPASADAECADAKAPVAPGPVAATPVDVRFAQAHELRLP